MKCDGSTTSMVLTGKVELNLKKIFLTVQWIPPNWSRWLPWIYHWEGTGRWRDLPEDTYGDTSWAGPWAPGSSHRTNMSLQHAAHSTWMDGQGPSLTWNYCKALGSGCSGPRASTNSRAENAKHTWAWSLSKNKLGESWTKWAWNALHRNYFRRQSGYKGCLAKHKSEDGTVFLMYFRM